MIAGIATAIVISNNDSSSEGYTIVDGSGKEIKVSGPVKSVVTVNTNVPKAMKILGLDDYVTGISNYSTPMMQNYGRCSIPFSRMRNTCL